MNAEYKDLWLQLWVKRMLGNGFEMGFIFRHILGPLVLGWAPNHFVLGAQLASVEKRLVCIPGIFVFTNVPNKGHFVFI